MSTRMVILSGYESAEWPMDIEQIMRSKLAGAPKLAATSSNEVTRGSSSYKGGATKVGRRFTAVYGSRAR